MAHERVGNAVSAGGRHAGRALSERIPDDIWQSSNNSDCSAATSGPMSSQASTDDDRQPGGAGGERLDQSRGVHGGAGVHVRQCTAHQSRLARPGQRTTDLAISKTQRLGGKSLSLRVDVLNIFDDPLFIGPVSTFGTSTFGQITPVGGFARSLPVPSPARLVSRQTAAP